MGIGTFIIFQIQINIKLAFFWEPEIKMNSDIFLKSLNFNCRFQIVYLRIPWTNFHFNQIIILTLLRERITPNKWRFKRYYTVYNWYDFQIGDCWMYDIERNCWTEIPLKVSDKRLWHQSVKVDSEWIVIGGVRSNIHNNQQDGTVILHIN
jgi:hypothetical protein